MSVSNYVSHDRDHASFFFFTVSTLVALAVVGAFFVVAVFLAAGAFLVVDAFLTAVFLVADLPSAGFLATGLASLTLPLIPMIMGSGHMSNVVDSDTSVQKMGGKWGIFRLTLGEIEDTLLSTTQGVVMSDEIKRGGVRSYS